MEKPIINKSEKQRIISSLSKEEYETGCKLAFRNAQSHLKSAIEVSKINEFGIANSLIILSAEELSKAFVLKIKSLDNKFPINNLYKYFENHKIKHDSIINLVISIAFQENEPETYNGDSKKEFSIYWKAAKYLYTIIIFAVLNIFTKKIFKHNENIEDETVDKENNTNLHHVSHFNEIKESGFYLGFDYVQETWKAPLELNTKDEFNEYKKIIEDVFDLFENAVINMNDIDDAIQILDLLDDKNIDKNYLNKLKKKVKQQQAKQQ